MTCDYKMQELAVPWTCLHRDVKGGIQEKFKNPLECQV